MQPRRPCFLKGLSRSFSHLPRPFETHLSEIISPEKWLPSHFLCKENDWISLLTAVLLTHSSLLSPRISSQAPVTRPTTFWTSSRLSLISSTNHNRMVTHIRIVSLIQSWWVVTHHRVWWRNEKFCYFWSEVLLCGAVVYKSIAILVGRAAVKHGFYQDTFHMNYFTSSPKPMLWPFVRIVS